MRWGRYNNRDVWEIMMHFIVNDHSGTMKLTINLDTNVLVQNNVNTNVDNVDTNVDKK